MDKKLTTGKRWSIYRAKAWKWFLHKLFGFDRWHVAALQERAYALDIIDYCNKRTARNSCVEIGCGLGDILLHLQYTAKLGLDAEENVLKAARFISSIKGSKARFSFYTFPDTPLVGKYDVIIMVNWIHHIPPAVLQQSVEELIESHLHEGGELILDTVQEPSYKYNHNIAFLNEKGLCEAVRIGVYERQREVWALKPLRTQTGGA
jgi:SAM-dependent methyltransferase